MAKGTHITLDQRYTILIEIKKGTTLNEIAKKIGDPTSISKEIRKHRYAKQILVNRGIALQSFLQFD